MWEDGIMSKNYTKQESFSIEADLTFEGPISEVITRLQNIKENLFKNSGCVSEPTIYNYDAGDNYTSVILWGISYDRAETEKEKVSRLKREEASKTAYQRRKEGLVKQKELAEATEYKMFLKLKEKFEK
jgi:hypothetical protein